MSTAQEPAKFWADFIRGEEHTEMGEEMELHTAWYNQKETPGRLLVGRKEEGGCSRVRVSRKL